MKLRLVLTLSLVPTVAAFAQQTPQQLADAELPSLVSIYKDLHTHPELSGHEERSAGIVAKELKAVGCEVTEKRRQIREGELAMLRRHRRDEEWRWTGVAVRTDLDALPVKEDTGLPYASTVTTKNDTGRRSRRDARVRSRHSHVHVSSASRARWRS